MQQYDNWREYWDTYLLMRYGKATVQTEEDLFFQVAQTLNRQPMAKEVFDEGVKQISEDLALSGNDILVDFCCGNGLYTYELRDKVKQIIGVDFSPSLLDAAGKYKSAPNITYCLESIATFIKTFRQHWPDTIPTKYLMNDSLAYFSPAELEGILADIERVSDNFKFLIRGVPNDVLKWNYYNTPERKAFYEGLLAKGDLTNDGLGRWWHAAEIEAICSKLNLDCVIRNHELPISDYRMDVIISR